MIKWFRLTLIASTLMFHGSCSSDSEEAPVPAQMETGFEFLTDAFVFENFGGDTAQKLTPALIVRMFGEEVSCETLDPCVLKGPAKNWMDVTNATLDQGRSEGFAMLSLAFFSGALATEDFGGVHVSGLRIEGNEALQQEFAYWAATQAVPAVGTEDKRFAAKSVMPFLAKALSPTSAEHYRIAIAQKTETGFTRGHALTPIGFYRGEEGTYWLRVYDNNFPQFERKMFIDPVNDIWRYEVPAIDGSTIAYEGTAENGNMLYFSPLSQRLGVLEAPFGADSKFVAISTSGVTVIAKSEDGAETGIRDGKVIEAEGDRVTPAFARCPLCGTPVPIVNQALLDKGVKSRSVEVTSVSGVSTATSSDSTGPSISGTGPGFSSSVFMGNESFGDTAEFGENGSVTYKAANNDDGVKIVTTFTDENGNSTTISVTVAASDTQANVKVSKNDEGKLVVEVEGLPAGTSVSVNTTTKDAAGKATDSGVTYTSNGNKSSATVTPGEEAVQTNNVGSVTLKHCTNELKDNSVETDVDCGGQCGATCVDGKVCASGADCLGGNCLDGVCTTIDCTDNVKSLGETDVDCGGPNCQRCVAGVDATTAKTCLSYDDCDSFLCYDGRCLKQVPVYARITNGQVPSGNTISVSGTFDGSFRSFNLDGAKVLADPIANGNLGKARKFQISSFGTCITSNALQSTGTSPGDTTLEGFVDLQCPPPGATTAKLKLDKSSDIKGDIKPTDPVRVAVSLDGGAEKTWELSGSDFLKVGFFQTNWSARLLQSPMAPFQDSSGVDFAVHCLLYEPFGARQYGQSVTSSYHVLGLGCYKGTSGNPCQDQVRTRDESDVDCGGTFCGGCDQGLRCNAASDCIAGASCQNNICFVPGTCTDGARNQGESDIDCGGPCTTKCVFAQKCSRSTDCGTGLSCASGECTPTACANGTKDTGEGDVDCGNTCALKCAQGLTCAATNDCESPFVCSGGNCKVDPCQDGRKNGTETDVDCGGSCAVKCAIGKVCGTTLDCSNGNPCLGGVCTDAQCVNGTKDGLETDIDCGGGACPTCAAKKACAQNTDCGAGFSCLNNFCLATTCGNGVKNGQETDVDCGGNQCAACQVGNTCSVQSDCNSQGVCNGTRCLSVFCNNNQQDGGESDIDCGMVCATQCGFAESCVADTDCQIGLGCYGLKCDVAACHNNVKDGSESAIDCGGNCATKCAGGQACGQTSDCAAGACVNNVCSASLCSDGIKNQDETDIDCGGPTCSACSVSKACTLDTDCASSDCECGNSSGNCAANSGVCGAGKWIFSSPTVDGVTATGTFTVPAMCSSVSVQAWGAAGSMGDAGMGAFGAQGGSGGFVYGTMSASTNDVFSVWIGQGGSTFNTPGTPGIGSLLGTPASGGAGSRNLFQGGGGTGGGLTSIGQTGATADSFVVPGGGSGDAFMEGQDVSFGFGGGNGVPSGQSAGFNSFSGGGGAGAEGGTLNAAGAYGTLPAGLQTADGFFGTPANTTNPDYSSCSAGAGASEGGSTNAGDGCVIIRCVAP